MRFVLAIPLFLVPAVADLALIYWLAKYRVDLTPFNSPYEGASSVWQVNVLRPANYSKRGKRLLPWLYLSLFITQVCLLAILYLVASA
jgi:hypothetical protein